jgi:hypothetical protein
MYLTSFCWCPSADNQMAQIGLALEMDVQWPVQIVVIVAIVLVRCQANIFRFYNSSIGPHPKPRNGDGWSVSC